MRIYFSGIGGVGIGPLARIAHDAGYHVLGSDAIRSRMADEIESLNIPISYDQSGNFLQSSHEQSAIDWFVYTAALSDDHPELIKAQELGIKVSKRDELLARIINEKNLKLIAVAGTHGKTTTTGMLIWTLMQLGLPISYSIGTTLSWGPSGHYDPKSDYFIYECDEFDRNFLHFTPHLSLITSIEYDHPDTYPTEEEYQSAFRQFTYESNMVILWQEDADYIKSYYSSAWSLQDNETLRITLTGAHNRRNGTLVLKALERLAIGEHSKNKKLLEQFPGSDRRFEKLADNLYTDYGHTPTEIKATLQLARELSDEVILVYQPHQNIRQHEIHDQYTNVIFQNADRIYWLPTYQSREDPILPLLTPEELTSNLANVHISNLDDSLWSEIQHHREIGHLVLCMGAGSIDGWVRNKLIK
jgi:UDP-N-acetylmuramate--alanine ligase